MQLLIDHIRCDNTTESGHDEVYMAVFGAVTDEHLKPVDVLVNGEMTKNGSFGVRVPNAAMGADADPNGPNGENTAWDCNDGGAMQDKSLSAPIVDIDLADALRLSLTILVLESDNWDYWKVVEAAADTAVVVGALASDSATAPVTVPKGIDMIDTIVAKLRTLLPWSNGDDHLGSILLHITSSGGQDRIDNVAYNDGAKSWGSSGGGVDPWTNKVHCLNDDGDYKIDFRVTGAAATRTVSRHLRTIEQRNRHVLAENHRRAVEESHQRMLEDVIEQKLHAGAPRSELAETATL